MNPNFYLLDEPTNHLDIDGQEALEAEAGGLDVSCIFVSHDRYFTRVAATRFVEIRKGRLAEVEDPDAFEAAGLPFSVIPGQRSGMPGTMEELIERGDHGCRDEPGHDGEKHRRVLADLGTSIFLEVGRRGASR